MYNDVLRNIPHNLMDDVQVILFDNVVVKLSQANQQLAIVEQNDVLGVLHLMMSLTMYSVSYDNDILTSHFDNVKKTDYSTSTLVPAPCKGQYPLSLRHRRALTTEMTSMGKMEYNSSKRWTV